MDPSQPDKSDKTGANRRRVIKMVLGAATTPSLLLTPSCATHSAPGARSVVSAENKPGKRKQSERSKIPKRPPASDLNGRIKWDFDRFIAEIIDKLHEEGKRSAENFNDRKEHPVLVDDNGKRYVDDLDISSVHWHEGYPSLEWIYTKDERQICGVVIKGAMHRWTNEAGTAGRGMYNEKYTLSAARAPVYIKSSYSSYSSSSWFPVNTSGA